MRNLSLRESDAWSMSKGREVFDDLEKLTLNDAGVAESVKVYKKK